jgi:diadenosine tetraphosphate (Ap4A) HIT family hydrolase
VGSNEYCRGGDFCEEMSGDSDTTFMRVYGGRPPSRKVETTDSFVVVADLSPLTVGHLLVLPRKHYLSFATVIPRHLDELRDLLDWLLPRYRMTFGEPAILEHGSAENFDHSACITHAHWHVVPVDGTSIDQSMTDDGLTSTDLRDIADLNDPKWLNSAYFLLLYRDLCTVFQPQPTLRRQYLRSVISRPLRIPDPEWDYAVVVRKNYLRSTMERVSNWSHHNGGYD